MRKAKNQAKIFLTLILLVLVIFAGFILIIKMTKKNPQKPSDYFCLIQPEKKPPTSFGGEGINISFHIQNRGRRVWSSLGENPILLSYHLLDENGTTVQYNITRFPLPRKVKPGQSIKMDITVKSPLKKGKYFLEFDLVREGIAWFKDYGSKTSKISLLVRERKWPEDHFNLSLDYGKYTKYISSIDELNKIQKLIRITLNQNDVQFQGKTGKIHGFSAGKDYPQIWLRDANAIIPVSRYFYNASYLRSWLEEHLAFQKEDGSLRDWIDSGGNSDKNTSATDQEASAVQAAFQTFNLLGPSWLKTKIKGEKIISKLERSLHFVLDTRLNKKYGLISGAHTLDWGDIDMVDKDQNAIYVDHRTHWTVDIYDQSMYCLACQNLAQMYESLALKRKSNEWLKTSEFIKKNTNISLWQKDKGFYRVHLHLDSLQHDFDEDNIFAMGGNTTAVLARLADEKKCQKIIEEAVKRQKTFQVSTISGTLLPPYPKNIFKHPLVDDPFEYQNGGQWDWFGGKLIYAMFEHGFSRLAKEKLIEIIKKNLANRGFYEWDNREGIGRGSDYFCGGAGSLGKALYEGYFGLKIGKDYMNIEPKIRKDYAKIHVHIPAGDIFVAYEYTFDPQKGTLTMRYNSNLPHQGTIKLLNPWQSLESTSEIKAQAHLIARLDGKEISFVQTKLNQDEFLEIETDFKNHTLEIGEKKFDKKSFYQQRRME